MMIIKGEKTTYCCIGITQGCESSDFNLISDVFCSSQNPIFRLLMQFECIEKYVFSGISDYFRLFLTDALTPDRP